MMGDLSLSNRHQQRYEKNRGYDFMRLMFLTSCNIRIVCNVRLGMVSGGDEDDDDGWG